MDYEVFLLSRIKERYQRPATTAAPWPRVSGLAAHHHGRADHGRVFAVFAATAVPAIQEIGLGLAVAIALDATLVRLVLVPATMELMGN